MGAAGCAEAAKPPKPVVAAAGATVDDALLLKLKPATLGVSADPALAVTADLAAKLKPPAVELTAESDLGPKLNGLALELTVESALGAKLKPPVGLTAVAAVLSAVVLLNANRDEAAAFLAGIAAADELTTLPKSDGALETFASVTAMPNMPEPEGTALG